jgi:hypothetical protein
MELFECCLKCKPPKRYPGCHSKCDDYLRDKKVLEKRNELINEGRKKSAYPYVKKSGK